jgi:glycosyltransferase involved in cell wall biosynthesis
MNIGILIPGFSSDENDAAIPVQHNLVRELARAHAVRVLALRYPHRRDVYTVFGATVHALGVGQTRGVGRLRLWLDALWTLRRLHRQKPFDVLHAMWADETGLLAAWAGKLLGVPSAVSVVGGELVGFDDIAYGLQRGAFSRWTVRQALEGADCVVIACEYIRGLLSRYRVRRVEKIVLGVDTTLFSSLPTHETARLVHVASLVGVKDQAMLLRAFASLTPQLPVPTARGRVMLDIIGTGPEEARLKGLAHELGIADRVSFVGAVPHEQLPAYYQRAALHVLSSRHEGLGMVTLEAAACGVPSVSTAVGLLPDCPEMGVCVPVGDEGALAAAVRALLDDPVRRHALGQAARHAVHERYTVQHTVDQLIALYGSLKTRAS